MVKRPTAARRRELNRMIRLNRPEYFGPRIARLSKELNNATSKEATDDTSAGDGESGSSNETIDTNWREEWKARRRFSAGDIVEEVKIIDQGG